MKYIPCLLFAFLLALCSCGGPSPAEELAAECGPDENVLRRLAVKALREERTESRRPIVKIERKIGPGDYMVSVLMDNGRTCTGRLFKDRARYRLTLDRSSVYQSQVSVKVEK